MKREFLLLMCVMWCVGVRLTPLENNDKLQDITNLYVAEWQWESWPVKQDLSEQDGRSPGVRKNVALWADSSKSAWYLFGGQPIIGDPTKIYSDVWKFKVKTRVWKRFFPSQGDVKPAFGNKKGGPIFRANATDGTNASYFEPITRGVVLCGGLRKKKITKTKTLNEWTSFRRKKPEEDKSDELSFLAIYAPKTTKSNTVWQIDVKEKIWTTYVCCCDTGKDKTQNSTVSPSHKTKTPNETAERNTQPIKNITETKPNSDDNTTDNQQLNIKNRKKKINQIKKITEKPQLKKPTVVKTENIRQERNTKETENDSNSSKQKTQNGNATDTKSSPESKGEGKPKNSSENEKLMEKHENPKGDIKYCPEFTETSVPVTWCDSRNEALVTADISSPHITVWVFNLSTSHWFQMQLPGFWRFRKSKGLPEEQFFIQFPVKDRWRCCVLLHRRLRPASDSGEVFSLHKPIKIADGVQWPGCSSTVRYVGNEEEIYIICSETGKQINGTNSFQNSTNPSEIPSDFNTKLVFRINYKEGILQSLGKIRLNPYFNSLEGEKVWRNDTHSILQLIKNSDNDTILILAYLDAVDLWILNKDHEGKEGFDLIEKIWRGSALKWFDKYNAALYSLQFVSESGNLETILLPNPRNITASEYWPRERGRFIIRVFKNENLKNQTFENRTREQNLTYELLQSDYKPSEVEHQLNHMYSLKALVFFGVSLTVFTVFGFVIFLKKCVTCPPKLRVRSECHKSPLIIRYSVIPDDLLYPVT